MERGMYIIVVASMNERPALPAQSGLRDSGSTCLTRSQREWTRLLFSLAMSAEIGGLG
jgi:hypothetical protein